MPVYLIYAGIIHAIGLALLLPMLITLPGPGNGVAPKTTAIDVEIIPAPPSASNIGQDEEQTSALPSAEPSAGEGAPVESEAEAADVNTESKPAAETPAAVANVNSEAQPEKEEAQTAAPAAEEPKAEVKAEPAKAAPEPASAKKPVLLRKKVARHAVRRPAKTQTKIAPFNGVLSGLFTPGAPAARR